MAQAQWCGPCKLIEPLVQSIADDYDGKVKVVKVDTDVHKDVVGQYGIYGLPLLIAFKNGDELRRHEGALNKAQLLDFVQTAFPEVA